jgi:hypothetical protein
MKKEFDLAIRFPRLTIGELKEILKDEPDDFVIRMGSEHVERFDYLSAIGIDNDCGTAILYFDGEK